MTNDMALAGDTERDKIFLLASNFFWFGFIVYIASYTISTTDQVNYVICNLFQILGLILMLPSVSFLIVLRVKNNYLKIVYFVYCLWMFIVIFRGIEFDYENIKILLFDPNSGIFLYLTPFLLLIPVNPTYLKKIFEVIVILGVIYLVYDIIFIKQLLYPYENMRSQAIFEYFTQQLSLPGGFLLLTYIYHSKKLNFLVLFTMVITFFLAVIRARRGLILMSFSMLFFTYLIYQYVNKTNVIKIILSLFLVSILTYAGVRIYTENRKDTFGLITERFGQQTRSTVEQYFYRGMETKDWVSGKGINGQYFCPGVVEGIGRVSIYRRVIETGYLQVILNGGLISLILLLLIIVPAIFLGIFSSRNVLSKAAGIWILLFLVYMYPGTITKFSLHYILVWLSVSICYSSEIRNMSEEDTLLFLKAARNGIIKKPD